MPARESGDCVSATAIERISIAGLDLADTLVDVLRRTAIPAFVLC